MHDPKDDKSENNSNSNSGVPPSSRAGETEGEIVEDSNGSHQEIEDYAKDDKSENDNSNGGSGVPQSSRAGETEGEGSNKTQDNEANDGSKQPEESKPKGTGEIPKDESVDPAPLIDVNQNNQPSTTTKGLLSWLNGCWTRIKGLPRDNRYNNKKLLLVFVVGFLLLVAYYAFGWQGSEIRLRGSSSVDISAHPVWRDNIDKRIQGCIPNSKTDEVEIKNFFDDASLAPVDDMNHDMNRYLYIAIMHAVVLGSRFMSPTKTFATGQKVSRGDVEAYLKVMLDTMKGEVIEAGNAESEFEKMNQNLYLTIVQASVLRNKYPAVSDRKRTIAKSSWSTNLSGWFTAIYERVPNRRTLSNILLWVEPGLRDLQKTNDDLRKELGQKDQKIRGLTDVLSTKEREIDDLQKKLEIVTSDLRACETKCPQHRQSQDAHHAGA